MELFTEKELNELESNYRAVMFQPESGSMLRLIEHCRELLRRVEREKIITANLRHGSSVVGSTVVAGHGPKVRESEFWFGPISKSHLREREARADGLEVVSSHPIVYPKTVTRDEHDDSWVGVWIHFRRP